MPKTKLINPKEEFMPVELRVMLKKESHHNHGIIKIKGRLYWQTNEEVRQMVEKIGLNEIMEFLGALGLNKNSEIVRKMYRDMGYSLFGYWEVFYWEVNNDIAHEYKPSKL